MKVEEIIANAKKTIEEIETLKKSYEDKMKKEDKEMPKEEELEKEAPASDAEADLLHQADEHSQEDGENLGAYAKQLSDEELYSLIEMLTEEAQGRGVSPEEGAPADAAAEEAPAEMEAEKSEEEPAAEEALSEEMEAPAEEMDDEMATLEEKVSGLSDEELKALLDAVSAESDKRSSPVGEAEVEKTQPPAMAAPEMSMMKSMFEKSESAIEKLANSVAAISKKLEKLEKSSEAKAAAVEEIPAQTYSDPKVKILEKSTKEDAQESMILGEELQEWLVGQQRKRTPGVNSRLVSRAGLIKSVEEAGSFYEEMKSLGLIPPKKK